MTHRNNLVIFVKEPVAGRVKTRLGRDIGLTNAAWWFRHQSRQLVRSLANDARWQTNLAVSPDRAGLKSQFWPEFSGKQKIKRWAQGGGDLGDRMGNVFRKLSNGPLVIIGADIPEITNEHINNAFNALGHSDAVIGPAPDGGYWLIGLKRSPRVISSDLLQNIRWSHPDTMQDTIVSLRKNLGKDAKVTMIDTLQDIDQAEDLAKINRQT